MLEKLADFIFHIYKKDEFVINHYNSDKAEKIITGMIEGYKFNSYKANAYIKKYIYNEEKDKTIKLFKGSVEI